MKKTIYVLSVIIAILLIASCTTFQISGVQIDKDKPSYQSVGEFDTTVMVLEFLGTSGGGNLFNVTAKEMDAKIYDTIQREISKFSGDAAVNVTIEYKATFVDMLLNGFTGSILAPAHARISGTIIKYN